MTQTKRNQVIKVNSLEEVLEKLDKLEEKEKSEYNLRQSIDYLSSKLNNALKKGYSYEDLTKILEEQKIFISVPMLRKYLRESAQTATSKKKTKSNSQKLTSANSDEAKSNNSQSIDSSKEINNDVQEQKRISSKNSSSNKQTETQKIPVLSSSREDLSADFNNH